MGLVCLEKWGGGTLEIDVVVPFASLKTSGCCLGNPRALACSWVGSLDFTLVVEIKQDMGMSHFMKREGDQKSRRL